MDLNLNQRYQLCHMMSCGASVNFVANIGLYDNFVNLVDVCHVPDMQLSDVSRPSDYTLFYTNSDVISLDFTDSRVEMHCPWNKLNHGETLLYIAYPFIELQHQQNKRLTCHAACVALGDHSVLLLGKEGAGKTTTAINLCQRFGGKLIANDLCVLGFNNGVLAPFGGTKFLFLRRKSVMRNLPALTPLFTKKQDSWSDKIKIQPEALSISIATHLPPINAIYMLHIDPDETDVYQTDANNLVTNLYLNENFCRYIRSSCTIPVSSDLSLLGYIPSFDSHELFDFRNSLISTMTKDLGIKYISGPLNSVSEMIVNSST